jgi:hypothetical protein
MTTTKTCRWRICRESPRANAPQKVSRISRATPNRCRVHRRRIHGKYIPAIAFIGNRRIQPGGTLPVGQLHEPPAPLAKDLTMATMTPPRVHIKTQSHAPGVRLLPGRKIAAITDELGHTSFYSGADLVRGDAAEAKRVAAREADDAAGLAWDHSPALQKQWTDRATYIKYHGANAATLVGPGLRR